MSAALALLVAAILDLLVGDPRWLPHPVRWMGWAIQRGETRFRCLPLPLAVSGGLMATGLILGTGFIALGIVSLAAWIHPWVGGAAELILLFYCLSARSLADAAMEVWRALVRGDLAGARRAVAMVVGRETDALDEAGVTRAAVETVAENLVDGFLAPLFWAALGGAPLALVYKMTNTLDSMIGYRNERYRSFGKVAARMDDVANWLPARLSPPLIGLAAALLNQNGRRAWRLARREGHRHSSPNAGRPEAAFAGALNVRLGGGSHYHGQWVSKPTIGREQRNATAADIPRAVDLMWLSAALGVVVAVGVRWGVS
jgi:adenosylcobinamide-phosphate synthase